MLAYKLLCAGGVGPFSRYAWPLPRGDQPGAWVMAPGDAAPCRTAVHGCRVSDLPWWLQDELWEAEFDGPIAAGRHKIVAPRARLVRRIEAWDAQCAQRFADACAWRARDHAVRALERAGDGAASAQLSEQASLRDLLALASDLEPPEDARINVTMAADAARRGLRGATVVAAYIAAHAAARLDGTRAMAAERAWQSDWLRCELHLRGDGPPRWARP